MNHHHPSDLKALRALMPARILSLSEAMVIAERQANRLLALHGLRHPSVPIDLITEQPRIRVEQQFDLPVSGSAHWDGQDWIITLGASEYYLRQRYTICHEFKHILDHPWRSRPLNLPASSSLTQEAASEKVADYFAACLLMPKAWIKDAFCNRGLQHIEDLANNFEVSPRAMAFRLSDLGLGQAPQRCEVSRPASPLWPQRYQRALSNSPIIITLQPEGACR